MEKWESKGDEMECGVEEHHNPKSIHWINDFQ